MTNDCILALDSINKALNNKNASNLQKYSEKLRESFINLKVAFDKGRLDDAETTINKIIEKDYRLVEGKLSIGEYKEPFCINKVLFKLC